MKSRINWMVARASQPGGEQEGLRELLIDFYVPTQPWLVLSSWLRELLIDFYVPTQPRLVLSSPIVSCIERDTAVNDDADGFDQYGDHANSQTLSIWELFESWLGFDNRARD